MHVAIEYAYGIVADYIWSMTHPGIFSPSSEKRYTSVILSTLIHFGTDYIWPLLNLVKHITHSRVEGVKQWSFPFDHCHQFCPLKT